MIILSMALGSSRPPYISAGRYSPGALFMHLRAAIAINGAVFLFLAGAT